MRTRRLESVVAVHHFTIYADKITREPVAIAAAKTLAVVRPVPRSLQTTCEGLTVIVTECACYARASPASSIAR
jgi:hypothetical protein